MDNKEWEDKEWEDFCKKINISNRENQKIFCKRSLDFIDSEDDIQINQGGMGLGKTLAISKVIQDSKNLFDHFFIATPISQIKKEWAKELKKIDLEFAIWFSKSTHCIEKINDPKFDVKDCNDDSKLNKELETYEGGKIYSDYCKKLASFIEYSGFSIEDYYEKNKDHCFIPINRYHLEKRKIIVGDYFGYLFPSMYRKVTNKVQTHACLVIDEAHMIPSRVSDLLSKKINLNQAIQFLKKEIETDYYLPNNIEEYAEIKLSVIILERIKDKLIQESTLKKRGNSEGRYDFNMFSNDWKKYSKEVGSSWSLFEFRDSLTRFIKYSNLDSKYETEEDSESYAFKLTKFIDNWETKVKDDNYSEQFQYYDKKEQIIQLKTACKNPADFLKTIWLNWRKIIMISGTIPDKNYFKNMLGLQNFNTIFESNLDSYKIKKDIIVYPVGDFTYTPRPQTYINNKKLLVKILKSLSGRTIIYVQSIANSTDIENQLRSEFKVFNFSKTEQGFRVNNNLLDKLKLQFGKEKNSIAITHITGKVEGQNYLDENGENISNIIIYGFPYPRKDLLFDDTLELYTKLFGLKEARKYVKFFPPNTTIYQAVMRAKRDEKHKPIILLWSKEFAEGSPGHKYTYDELKGQIIYNPDELLNVIKKRDNERRNL